MKVVRRIGGVIPHKVLQIWRSCAYLCFGLYAAVVVYRLCTGSSYVVILFFMFMLVPIWFMLVRDILGYPLSGKYRPSLRFKFFYESTIVLSYSLYWAWFTIRHFNSS